MIINLRLTQIQSKNSNTVELIERLTQELYAKHSDGVTNHYTLLLSQVYSKAVGRLHFEQRVYHECQFAVLHILTASTRYYCCRLNIIDVASAAITESSDLTSSKLLMVYAFSNIGSLILVFIIGSALYLSLMKQKY